MKRYDWLWRTALLVGLSLGAGCAGCKDNAEQSATECTTEQIASELERANRLAADRSQLQIEGYIRRQGLEGMHELSNGLYVSVHGRALGRRFVEGERAKVAYRLELLDGTVIREIDSTRAETLMLGARDRTAGLDMLITAMAPGQQAVGIVPSRLGYGIGGDGSSVPPHACLRYNVTWARRIP